MKAFIMSISDEAWERKKQGRTNPVVVRQLAAGSSDPVTTLPKARADRAPNERALAHGNSKALNAIFSTVDETQFKMISTYETAKSTWDALQVAYEGSIDVRTTKLQRVESTFDSLRMADDENISIYYSEFKDVVNQAYLLGLVYDDKKLVDKVLRTIFKEWQTQTSEVGAAPHL